MNLIVSSIIIKISIIFWVGEVKEIFCTLKIWLLIFGVKKKFFIN